MTEITDYVFEDWVNNGVNEDYTPIMQIAFIDIIYNDGKVKIALNENIDVQKNYFSYQEKFTVEELFEIWGGVRQLQIEMTFISEVKIANVKNGIYVIVKFWGQPITDNKILFIVTKYIGGFLEGEVTGYGCPN